MFDQVELDQHGEAHSPPTSSVPQPARSWRAGEPFQTDSWRARSPVDRLCERASAAARADARFYASILEVAEASSDQTVPDRSGADERFSVDEFGADEVRAALSWTRRAAERAVLLAWQMCRRLPAVWIRLNSGAIDLARARVICDGLDHVEDVELARWLASDVLERAEHRTTGQLRADLRRAVMRMDPQGEGDRYRRRVARREVWLDATAHGTANLYGWDLPADRANAAFDNIDRMAKAAKTETDHRSIDQVRADVFLDLLCGIAASGTGAGRPTVDLRVDLETLVGLSDEPGEIPGWGPVVADLARQVAADARDGEWRYTVVGDDNQIVANGITRRRPLTDQRRFVEARDRECVFPGCRTPAATADLDHLRSHGEGGATSTENLAPLCRHDHRLKHDGGWKVARTGPGEYTWTSRLGQTYVARTSQSQARAP